jgi:hypothetical protein
MRKLSDAPSQQTSIFNWEKCMSIRKRLNQKHQQPVLSQKKSGKFRRAKKPFRLSYEAGEGTLNDDYWRAVVVDVVRHYVSAGETKHDRLLAAMAQLLTGLRADHSEQVTDALDIIRAEYIGPNCVNDDAKKPIKAIPDYGVYELTLAEKNLIAAYRKATQTDKSLIDRLARLVKKAAEHEIDAGIAENVIDGE